MSFMIHVSPEEEELLKKAWTAYDWSMLKFNSKLRFLFQGLRTRYRKSFLGFLWSLLSPLLSMVVLAVVFSFAFKQDIKTVKDIGNYATEQLQKRAEYKKNKFINSLVD